MTILPIFLNVMFAGNHQTSLRWINLVPSNIFKFGRNNSQVSNLGRPKGRSTVGSHGAVLPALSIIEVVVVPALGNVVVAMLQELRGVMARLARARAFCRIATDLRF